MRLGVASTFPPYRGGIAQFNAAMTIALEAAGHDVARVTWSRQYPSILFPGTSQWEPGKGLQDAEMPALLDSLSPLSWTRTGRALAASADVVVLPFWHAALAPALTGVAKAARQAGAKKVYALMHNATSHDGNLLHRTLTQRFPLPSGWGGHPEHPCERRPRLSPAHHVVSPLVRPPRFWPAKGRARRQLGLNEGQVVHLFFGLIRPYKGLSVLLEAMALLPEEHMLVVAGECYGSWEPYAQTIRQLGLEERVMLHTSFVDDKDVPVYFSAADDVVLPYTQASQSGVTAVALHHERRVIASEVGDLPTTIVPELTGRLVPARDAEALAEAMVKPWLAQPCSVRAAFGQVKKRLSWSAWASQLTQQVGL